MVALCQKWAFWLYFWNLWTNFFKYCKIQLYFTYSFLNLPQLCMLITRKICFFHLYKFWIFLKILSQNLNFRAYFDCPYCIVLYECGKVKKVMGNKSGITIYSWTLWWLEVENFQACSLTITKLYLEKFKTPPLIEIGSTDLPKNGEDQSSCLNT